MEPFIRSGDILIVDPLSAEKPGPGDVVLYCSPGGPCVHRVKGRRRGAYKIQGDSPECLEEDVPESDLLGRIDILERRGRRVRLDRGAQRAMRWPGARIPIGRRISRTLGGWGTAIRERLDRDGGDLLRVVSLCGPSVRVDGLLPESEPEWEDLVSVAVTRDLAPLLYFQFQRSGTELPLEVSRALSRAYYGSAARYVVMINAFGEVLKAITDAGISTMVLKGVALAETVYPSPATRPMNDVDLLVSPGHLRAADRVLNDLGYLPIDGPIEGIDPHQSTSLSTLDYRKADLLSPSIHLHWHLVNTSIPTEAYRDFVGMDEIWEEALPFSVDGTKTLRVAPHHLLVYLCEHAMRPAHSMWKPLQVVDLAWAIGDGMGAEDWERVLETARRFRLDRMAYLPLRVVRDQMDAPVPDETLAALKPAHLTSGERLFLRRLAKGRTRSGLSYFVHLALRHGPMDKARFIFKTVFPSNAVVAHHTQEHPRRWFIKRIFQVLKHAFGR